MAVALPERLPPTYHARAGILMTDLGDELVLVDAQSGHSYRVNATARQLWLSLPSTAEAAARLLVRAFEIDGPSALEDAGRWLDELEALGLVQRQAE